MQQLTVHRWPGPVPSPTSAHGVCVIGVPTAPERERAREEIRRALTEVLAAMFAVAQADIIIDTATGAKSGVPPLALLPGGRQLHCSFAHENGLSLAAISLHGPVGVDLMCTDEFLGWQAVARDYLGPETSAQIAATPAPQRATAFARAWTAREAHLKWLGVGLDEWPAHSQPGGAVLALDLPAGLVGTLVCNQSEDGDKK